MSEGVCSGGSKRNSAAKIFFRASTIALIAIFSALSGASNASGDTDPEQLGRNILSEPTFVEGAEESDGPKHPIEETRANLDPASENSAACSVDEGRRAYKLCAACHRLEANVHTVGPALGDIFGRRAASVDGFRYSRAMRNLDVVWDQESLDAFLASPQKFAPGTIMAFSGLRKKDDRDALICYLMSMRDDRPIESENSKKE